MIDYEKDALGYHERAPRGKIAIQNTKPLETQEDLSLAYSPGVAGPCRAIHQNQDESFRYTARGNLVGVISNGTAVLGLGAIGPYAAKPVMEGKGMLFKKFADIDVFDIEIDANDPDDFIRAVKALEPTFGGINLEDIKGPECFYIEETLKKSMSIPVFHDDQHGTAIIAGAAFLNALEITKRDIKNVKIVFSGAGAAAIGCAILFEELGLPKENLILCDSQGVVSHQREDLNPYKKRFASNTKAKTLAEALKGAHAFIGVSAADILTPDMLKSMAPDPIVFALANPNPEIKPELAKSTRSDVIIATGRSDYPNQVNNLLGFPYIFRGALDVRARTINTEMKLAAVKAIAELAKEDVPEDVIAIYKNSFVQGFGRDYLIPKPVDQRVLLKVAPAVARAAMESGVARVNVDLELYQEQIERILGPTRRIVRHIRKEISVVSSGKTKPRIVLTSGENIRVLKAAKELKDGGELQITLVGKRPQIEETAHHFGVNLDGMTLCDPQESPLVHEYAEKFFELRKRRGISLGIAKEMMLHQDYFAAMMLKMGHVDGLINGVTGPYKNSVLPLLEVIGPKPQKVLAGIYMMVIKEKTYFFADCTINIDPTGEQLAEIAYSTAEVARALMRDPIRVAFLSFANYGTSKHPEAVKVSKAVEILKTRKVFFEFDGEMQVDTALNENIRKSEFPFTALSGNANVLICPNLSSANIGYKLLHNIADAIPTGPILVGLSKPAHVMQRCASVQEIVNMAYVSAHQALNQKF